jgi:hypothetical protein
VDDVAVSQVALPFFFTLGSKYQVTRVKEHQSVDETKQRLKAKYGAIRRPISKTVD